MDITGINGATASSHGGVKQYRNHPYEVAHSFTMSATITTSSEPDGILFKQTYPGSPRYGQIFVEAMKLFRKSLQIETDKYIA